MIGIINYHRADNYGAVLQSYALQKVIFKCGYDCEIINYKCSYISNHYKLLHFNNLSQLASDVAYLSSHIQKKRGFKRFRRDYLVLSETSYDKHNINESNMRYRVFVTGSDQVFNYTNTGFDKTYFLNFVESKNVKCSYAASFGFSEIPKEYKKIYKELLTGFKYISFREQTGSALYKELTSEEAPTLLDPTLIADREIWRFDNDFARNNEPYILVYFLERSSKAFAFVDFLKQQTSMKVIYIGSLIKVHRNNLDADYMAGLSPDEFVLLFKNASYVVTNSFHGTAFSIIFEKQFWVNLLENGKATNDRFMSLLNQLGLNDRFIPSDEYNTDFLNKKIDYNEVNKLLKECKQKAINFIKKICEMDGMR